DGYLAKPFDPWELGALVGRLVARSERGAPRLRRGAAERLGAWGPCRGPHEDRSGAGVDRVAQIERPARKPRHVNDVGELHADGAEPDVLIEFARADQPDARAVDLAPPET